MIKIQNNWRLPSLSSVKNNKPIIQYTDFNLEPQYRGLGLNKYYYLRTYGCQANERDSESIAGILELLGFKATQDKEKCDLIILNTCAVRKNAEDKVLGELGSLKKYCKVNPNLVIALAGCMAQEEGIVELILTKYRHVNLIFGTHNINNLPNLLASCFINHQKIVEVISNQAEVVEDMPISRFKNHKAWINIMYGCDKFCSYCIVPYTRGRQRSRKMADIIKEINACQLQGCQEVSLLGQNVNAYGKDFALDDGFATLLAEVAKTGIARIRFVTSHPWDFSDKMIEVVAQCTNIMPYIHLPVQAGSNEILTKMGRRYTVEQYKTLYDKLKIAIPNIAFTTDIIVGFPGETAQQFMTTLDLVKYCKFDNIYSFIYSPREQTPAALMIDDVPEVVKKQRLKELNDLFKVYALENSKRYIDTIEEVLVDGWSKTNKNVYSGYTKTNKLVNFTSELTLKSGDFIAVKIIKAKTFTLEGIGLD